MAIELSKDPSLYLSQSSVESFWFYGSIFKNYIMVLVLEYTQLKHSLGQAKLISPHFNDRHTKGTF